MMMELLKENQLTLKYTVNSSGTMSRNDKNSRMTLTLIDFDPNSKAEAIYLAEGVVPGKEIPCGVVGNGKTIDECVTDLFKQIQGKSVAMCIHTGQKPEVVRRIVFPEVIRNNEIESIIEELRLTIN